MEQTEITTPRQLGDALKKEFKKYGIDIVTRYIKTVRGLDNSWYEISTFKSNHIIPNELRKTFVSLNYDKPFQELNIINKEDIHYGNTQSQRVALYGRDWKKWLSTCNK